MYIYKNSISAFLIILLFKLKKYNCFDIYNILYIIYNIPYLTLPGRACSAVNNIFSSIHFCPPSLRAVHLIRILYLLLVDR